MIPSEAQSIRHMVGIVAVTALYSWGLRSLLKGSHLGSQTETSRNCSTKGTSYSSNQVLESILDTLLEPSSLSHDVAGFCWTCTLGPIALKIVSPALRSTKRWSHFCQGLTYTNAGKSSKQGSDLTWANSDANSTTAIWSLQTAVPKHSKCKCASCRTLPLKALARSLPKFQVLF